MKKFVWSALLVVLALASTACSDSPAPSGLATVCTSVVNDRIDGQPVVNPIADTYTWVREAKAGRESRFSPAALSRRARAMADDITWSADQLDRPASAVDGGTDWLDSWRETAQQWSRRADAFDGSDPDRVQAAWFGPGENLVVGTDPPRDVASRDCRLVFAPAADADAVTEFDREASVVCSSLVSEQFASGVMSRGMTAMFDVFAAVHEDRPITVDDDQRAAIDAAADAWADIADRIDGIGAERPEQAQEFVDSVHRSAQQARERADAVDSGDENRIRAAFGTAMDSVATTRGLQDRDCRLLGVVGELGEKDQS